MDKNTFNLSKWAYWERLPSELKERESQTCLGACGMDSKL